MNRTLLFISLFSIFILVSCQSSPKNEAGKQNEVELVAEKQLAFPLDEQTYYLSKSMFQFEENGKEYLHFENTQKSLYDIVIFDIENQTDSQTDTSSQDRSQRATSCIRQ